MDSDTLATLRRRKQDVEETLKSNTEVDEKEKIPRLPEFTFKNVILDLIQMPFKLALSPFNFELVTFPIWILDSLLLKYIITNIPYTEIDYSTYMQQVNLFWEGERDYLKIEGDTGPLVYPAGHLWVYTAMRWVSGSESHIPVNEKKSIVQALVGNAFLKGKEVINEVGGKVIDKIASEDLLETALGGISTIEGMQNVIGVQHVFRWIYLFTLIVLFAGYWLLNSRIPSNGSGFKFIDDEVRKENTNNQLWGFSPYLLVILVASKRLHSLYVLRLFNDCFVTMFMALSWLFILIAVNVKREAFKLKSSVHEVEEGEPTLEEHASASNILLYLLTFGSVFFYSLALSVKMSALLYLPGYIIVMYLLCSENLFQLVIVMFVGLEVQIVVNWPFLSVNREVTNNFLKQAFDFGRVFMYKWTVNWKFLPEEVFLSNIFHLGLLVLHCVVVLWFVFKVYISSELMSKGTKQFVLNDGILKPFQDTLNKDNIILSEVGEVYVTYVLFSCNLIGVLFSRSLHYQFLVWYQWTLPFIYHCSGLPWYFVITLAAAHEWCWCVFPSTEVSSAVLVGILTLLLILLSRFVFSRDFN